jgi:nucleoside-diphosphate-sugar epimerase
MKKSDKILVTGAGGQLGGVLTESLARIYPDEQIFVTDIRPFTTPHPFYEVDVTDRNALATVVRKEGITQIYHLAAILSAKGEENPLFTQDVNIQGLLNVLEVARQEKVQKVFCPSSIAVFGEGIHRDRARQQDVLIPRTVYGITKVAGELWAKYYWDRYQVDVRSLRYPGVVGYQTLPGGGTTDYAVDIYHAAVKAEPFACFLKEDAELPMIYMEDAIRATLELMEAPAEKIRQRTSYNLQGFSFTPGEIYASIKKYIPNFVITYAPDHRQAIAEAWPRSIDDSEAREDWGWNPRFTLDEMTKDMIKNLRKQNA